MLIIQSLTYGDIVIPFTATQSERYSANVPMYSRDNTSSNVMDSVGSGAIMKPNVLSFVGMLTNNDAGFLPFPFDIEGTRQALINIVSNSELLTIIFGLSNSIYFFGANPVTWKNVVIQDLQIDADETTGAAYNVTITFSQQILVNTIFNPQVINVNGGTAAGGNDTSQKSLNPQNNGTTTPQFVNNQTISNDIANLKRDL